MMFGNAIGKMMLMSLTVKLKVPLLVYGTVQGFVNGKMMNQITPQLVFVIG